MVFAYNVSLLGPNTASSRHICPYFENHTFKSLPQFSIIGAAELTLAQGQFSRIDGPGLYHMCWLGSEWLIGEIIA